MNKSKNQQLIGHLLALFTIIVWGTTFIATKLLLTNFSPIHIMLMRFTLAYVVLFILKPKPLFVDVKTEAQFALLGLFGWTLYFLTENNALTYTYAANVSIIVASAPILTALLVHLFHKEEKVDRNNIYGFFGRCHGGLQRHCCAEAQPEGRHSLPSFRLYLGDVQSPADPAPQAF